MVGVEQWRSSDGQRGHLSFDRRGKHASAATQIGSAGHRFVATGLNQPGKMNHGVRAAKDRHQVGLGDVSGYELTLAPANAEAPGSDGPCT